MSVATAAIDAISVIIIRTSEIEAVKNKPDVENEAGAGVVVGAVHVYADILAVCVSTYTLHSAVIACAMITYTRNGL